ncbi:MAG: hypothetical protein WC346_18010 [Methanogenium sp.]
MINLLKRIYVMIGKIDMRIDIFEKQAKNILKNKTIDITVIQKEYSSIKFKITMLEVQKKTLLEVIEMIGSDKK